MQPHRFFIHQNNRPTQPAVQPVIAAPQNRLNPIQAQKELFAAIEYASENDFPNLCEKAIQHGADINGENLNGYNVIEFAVKRGSIQILRHLFARGAIEPPVSESGIDILMLAANQGHTEIVEFLISEVGLVNDAVDQQGLSALHYAALVEKEEAIKILIDYDSDVNALSKNMNIQTMGEIFNKNLLEFNFFSDGSNITPLMIAVAKNDHKSAALLIKNDAKIDLGKISPLIIAIKNNDAEMVEMLCLAQAFVAYPMALNGQNLIEFSIKNNVSTTCFSSLLKTALVEPDFINKHSLSWLSLSLQNHRLDYFASMLAAGIKIEKQNDYINLYMTATTSPNKNSIVTLLAYLHADEFTKKIESANDVFFADRIKENFSHYELTAMGVFPHAANIYLSSAPNALDTSMQITAAQKKLVLANKLTNLDPPTQELFSEDFYKFHAKHIDITWIKKIEAQAQQQFSLLATVSKNILLKKNNEFKELISTEFFKICIAANKSPEQIERLIVQKFTNEIGLPYAFSLSLALIYTSRIKLVCATQYDKFDLNERAMLAQKMTINLIRQSGFLSIKNNCEITSNFIKVLTSFLSESEHQLATFFANPVQAIRKIENRQGLQPVAINSLIKQLSLHLGLPLEYCERITKAWSQSVSKTSQTTTLRSGYELNHALTLHFAEKLASDLVDIADDPSVYSDVFIGYAYSKLSKWCDNQLHPNAMNIIAGNNRPPNESEPPAKKIRLQ